MGNFNCFSLKLAGFLMMKGFVLFEVKSDKRSKRKIYKFRDSEELRNALTEYSSL